MILHTLNMKQCVFMIINSIIVVVLGVFPVRPIGRRRGSLANVKFSVCSCCIK